MSGNCSRFSLGFNFIDTNTVFINVISTRVGQKVIRININIYKIKKYKATNL